MLGVGGNAIPVRGQLDTECKIAGRKLTQTFVVADICEAVLLGMTFISRFKTVWDWHIGGISF